MVTKVPVNNIDEIVCQQRQFFALGKTKDVRFRIEQLQKLKQAIASNQAAIMAALQGDLRKPELESYANEIRVPVTREIEHVIKQIKSWTKPHRVSTPIEQFPATAKIIPEPLGVVLIIAPWNYPFQLIMSPLVGAIAAGNCAILKPSEISPRTSGTIASIIEKTFDPEYIAVVEGGVETSQQLLAEKFDHIFFTGGTAVGKIVMAAAAQHLTPVTLELGGKSPCIVDSNVNLECAAKRIVWGKFINAGQSCIAPDYLLVDKKIKPQLLDRLKSCIVEFYGTHPDESPDYARIINPKQFYRLVELLEHGKIIIGGHIDAEDLYIAPTVIDNMDWDAPAMQEEIFGPILPVLEYTTMEEAIALINEQPKPLALYLFSRNKKYQKMILQQTSSGGVCLNDTMMQYGVSELPFGGVGNSGLGSYHGKASFDSFSHYKSVLTKSFLFDLPLRYAPYQGKLKLLKWLIG
ncbi:MAG: aldehyde dehydrogenase [Hormoscilla sp.]